MPRPPISTRERLRASPSHSHSASALSERCAALVISTRPSTVIRNSRSPRRRSSSAPPADATRSSVVQARVKPAGAWRGVVGLRRESATLPHRAPLLGERARPLDEVLALDHRDHLVVGRLARFLDRSLAEALVGRLLRRAHRERRALEDLVGPAPRARE